MQGIANSYTSGKQYVNVATLTSLATQVQEVSQVLPDGGNLTQWALDLEAIIIGGTGAASSASAFDGPAVLAVLANISQAVHSSMRRTPGLLLENTAELAPRMAALRCAAAPAVVHTHLQLF